MFEPVHELNECQFSAFEGLIKTFEGSPNVLSSLLLLLMVSIHPSMGYSMYTNYVIL